MKKVIKIGIIFAVFLFSSGFQTSFVSAQKLNVPDKDSKMLTATVGQKKVESLDYVEGEVLVKFRRKNFNLQALKGQNEVRSFAQKRGVVIKDNIKLLNASLLKSDTKSTDELISELKRDPSVEYAEPNYIYHQLSIPNDSYFVNQWGLHNTGQTVNNISGTNDADIDMPEAWDFLSDKSTSEVVVAVIDGGVDLDHPDLSSQLLPGYDFADGDSTPQDLDGHGTHVTGIIGGVAGNNQGIAGFNSKIKIIPLRVFDASGNTTATKIALAIYEAYDKKAKIVNMSIGGGEYSQVIYDAMKFGISLHDTLFIVAAGNEGSNNDTTLSYPASYDLDNIISVAATDQNDNLAAFSNYGSSSVDVAAPGVNIYSTYLNFEQKFIEDFESASIPNLPSTFVNDWSLYNWQTANSTDNKFVKPNSGYNASDFSIMHSTVDVNTTNYDYSVIKFNLLADIAPACDHLSVYIARDTDLLGAHVDFLDGYFNGSAVSLDLTDAIRRLGTKVFKLRFIWSTDSSSCSRYFVAGGLIPIIDNIGVYGISKNAYYEYSDGTSMAAPYVTGLAALIKSVKPALTYDKIKKLIINNVDKKDSLAGKILSGGRINSSTALQIASTAPITSLSFLPATPDGSNDSFRIAPLITLVSTDQSGLGVAKTYYKWDDGSLLEYSTPFKAPEGAHTLYYYSSDDAGNTEQEKTYNFTLDSTPPSEIPSFTPYGRIGANYTALSITGPHKDPEPRFEWTQATDSVSGIKGYYVLWTTDINEDPVVKGIFQSSTSFVVPRLTSKGSYYLKIKTVDNNGNISPGSYISYNADPDLIAPSLKIKNSFKASSSGKYRIILSPLKVSISADDGILYCFLNNHPCPYLYGEVAMAKSGRYALLAYAIDFYGNKSAEKKIVYNVVVPPLKERLKELNKDIKSDAKLTDRLKGRILLQTQGKGEAWYLNPKNGKRYFLNKPDDALQTIKKLGVGINNKNLAKIPRFGTKDKGDQNFSDKLKGKIVIAVQDKGKAWYISPANGKRYFMGGPDDAFKLMKKLGMGINDSNLNKIFIGLVK